MGTIPAVELAVGETETIDVSQYFTDPDGDALNYVVASSDTTSATATASGNAVTVRAVAAGTATITVTATDPDAASAGQSFNVTVPNRAPERTDTIPDQELAVGDSAVFDLADYFHDPDGDALGYAPETSDEAVATVSVSNSMLTVRAVAKGRAKISVTVADRGGLMVSDSFDVTVPNQAPIVTDTIPTQSLTVGDGREWTGSEHFADPDGDTLTYTAGTTNASIVLAIVSGGDFGIVAVAPGTATVTVTATDGDGLSASQSFQVTSEAPLPVVITQVEPTVLIEGAPATIHGSGFSSVPGNNTVLVDGFRAMVTEATSTRLSVTVPYADCRPPRQAQLRVTVGSLTDARTVGVTPVSREDLELPQGFYKVTPAGYGCLHLPGDATGGDYLIGVVSTSEVPSTLTPVTMTNTLGDPTVVADFSTVAAAQGLQRAAAPIGLSPAGYRSVPAAAPSDSRIAEAQSFSPTRDWERDSERLAGSLDIIRNLGPAISDLGRARRSRASATGDTLTLFVDGNPTCTTRSQVRAVVRLVGGNAIWLDDIDNPSSTFTDTELAELDAFYASHVKGVHDDYFGGLTDVDGNDRIRILMTKEVNKQDRESVFTGGWVWSPDLLPTTRCRTSNEAEIFFGRVPDPDGVFGQAWTKQQTMEYYPSLLTHEITHLVQFAALLRGGGDTEIWALEGGAVLSEQLVAYRIFGHGSGRNLGYAAYERGRRWWYGPWVAGLARFFGWDSDDESGVGRVPRAPEQCTWLGRPEDGNDGPCRGLFRAVYDVPSVLLRYAMDRWGDDYPGGEQALMTRLTQSPRRGYAALEEVGSWRIEQILTDFYLSLWLDLYGADAYGMKSWDLADIWSRFPESRWLVPYASSSRRFRGDWSVRAGSTFYLRWQPNGSRGPTSLKVTSPTGAPVPRHISVWALRIR